MTVYCQVCRQPVELPDDLLDQLEATADVTCGKCIHVALERRERTRAERWGRQRGVALPA